MSALNDDELDAMIREHLHAQYPPATDIPSDARPISTGRPARRGHLFATLAAAAVVVAVAAGLALAESGRTTEHGVPPRAPGTAPSTVAESTYSSLPAPPGGPDACLPQSAGPATAPQFVGLSLDAAQRLATSQRLVLVPLCIGSHRAINLALDQTNAVFVVVDGANNVVVARYSVQAYNLIHAASVHPSS